GLGGELREIREDERRDRAVGRAPRREGLLVLPRALLGGERRLLAVRRVGDRHVCPPRPVNGAEPAVYGGFRPVRGRGVLGIPPSPLGPVGLPGSCGILEAREALGDRLLRRRPRP